MADEMATTRDDIRDWLMRAKTKDASHMLVVYDSFSRNDYPVYVKKRQDVREIAARYDGKDMDYLMEVYNLSMDLEAQLAKLRSFNY
jgi:hypothetical protein